MGVQNRSIKNMGCKIAQLIKDRQKSAIKPLKVRSIKQMIHKNILNFVFSP